LVKKEFQVKLKAPPCYPSIYFEGSPPWRSCYIFYVPMFPWKDFLMGLIRNIQKHKEERTDQENSKKQEGKNGGMKKRYCYICEGSHTRVFSISREHPQATTLMWHSLRRTHLYGNPTNNILTGLLCWVIPFFLSVCMMRNIGW